MAENTSDGIASWTPGARVRIRFVVSTMINHRFPGTALVPLDGGGGCWASPRPENRVIQSKQAGRRAAGINRRTAGARLNLPFRNQSKLFFMRARFRSGD